MRFLRTRRSRSIAVGLAAVMSVNATFLAPAVGQRWDEYQAQTARYKAKYGHWDVITLPTGHRVSAVHAALLPTGKILLTAGSANDAHTFAAGTFTTAVYDPDRNTTTLVHTPSDMFCGGQAFLPDGRLLIAGGTQNYEVLAPDAKKAGGILTVQNFDTNGAGRLIGSQSILIGSNGQRYLTDASVVLDPARRYKVGKQLRLAPGRGTVWAWAVNNGTAAAYTSPHALTFAVAGLDTASAATLKITGNRLVVTKHNFEGSAFSYIFDPSTESYIRVSDMTVKRWYPSMVPMSDGNVLAVSGLNGVGGLVAGPHTAERFDPIADEWTALPKLTERFPTYPSLFQTSRPGQLFYTGSNSGYGDDKINGHVPGFWNLNTNAFSPARGLRQPTFTDSSGSAWIGPVQNQRLALVGGGLAGESLQSTERIDTISLNAANPSWTAGPDLPRPTRYPLLVDLPDDSLLITGGAGSYRSENASSNHDASLLDPTGTTLTRVASPHVARSYHSEALLLPDGRVLTMGSNPLYSDAANTRKAAFEQRLELYTPAYLYRGPRPTISSAPTYSTMGGALTVDTPQPADVMKVRLISPGAATHASNLGQRSVAVAFTSTATGLRLRLPASTTIMPRGYYMMFLVNRAGVPSVAHWILVR